MISLEKILVATRNRHKLTEITELLGSHFEIFGMDSISDIPHIEESEDSFEANACLKAEFTSKFFNSWVLADDSGLEVDALEGAPGVLSARFAGKNATDAENRLLLLQRLEKVGSEGKQRSARFRCVLALAKDGKTILSVSSTCEGIITKNEIGKEGFGYDSLFRPIGHSETLAELPPAIKNQISHRGRAIQELLRIWSPIRKYPMENSSQCAKEPISQ